MRDKDQILLEKCYFKVLKEYKNEEYFKKFNNKNVLIRWEDKDSPFGRLRMFDPDQKHTYREYGKDITDYKQIGLIDLKYDPDIHQKYGLEKSTPSTSFTSSVEYYKDKIIVGLVFVDKEYRNKGYAKFLLELAEEYAKSKGIEYLFVEFATPKMLKIIQSKFSNVKFEKDPNKKGEFKAVLIKI